MSTGVHKHNRDSETLNINRTGSPIFYTLCWNHYRACWVPKCMRYLLVDAFTSCFLIPPGACPEGEEKRSRRDRDICL